METSEKIVRINSAFPVPGTLSISFLVLTFSLIWTIFLLVPTESPEKDHYNIIDVVDINCYLSKNFHACVGF